jgi:hypothetical protein
MNDEATSFVWVNTAAGWVAHGGPRAPSTAVRVAKRLRALDGWDTAAGASAPPPCQAPENAPSPEVAAHSPAPLATWPRRASSRRTESSRAEHTGWVTPGLLSSPEQDSTLSSATRFARAPTLDASAAPIEHELRNFYETHGLSAERFRCKHAWSCSAVCTRFVGACEAFIGSAYNTGVVPRLVFVSADPARDLSAGHPPDRAMPAVRAREESRGRPISGSRDFPKRGHWYKTFQFAHRFFETVRVSAGQPPIPFAEVNRYFAHTNSAKCKDLAKGTAQGNQRLFANCSNYIASEVAALGADVVVTQGQRAKDSIARNVRILEAIRCDAHPAYRCDVIQVGSKSMLWIAMNHPNARDGSYQAEVRLAWDWYLVQGVNYMRRIQAPPFGAAGAISTSPILRA